MMMFGMMISFAGCGNPLNKEIEETPAPVEEVVEQSDYDEKFLEIMAKAVTFKQENLKKANENGAITGPQIYEAELAMHEDYSTKNFKDEILKVYATNYLAALNDELELSLKGYDQELTAEEEYILFEASRKEMIDVIVALIDDYDLAIDEELKNAYKNGRKLYEIGNYTILEKAEMTITYNEETGMTVIEYSCKNPSIYDFYNISLDIYAYEKLSDDTWRISPNTPVEAYIDEWKSNETFEITIEVMGKFEKDDLDISCKGGIWL